VAPECIRVFFKQFLPTAPLIRNDPLESGPSYFPATIESGETRESGLNPREGCVSPFFRAFLWQEFGRARSRSRSVGLLARDCAPEFRGPSCFLRIVRPRFGEVHQLFFLPSSLLVG